MLFLIALDNTISAQRAANYLGVSQRMVENYLQQLREQEILDRIGGDFGGQWLIQINKQLENRGLKINPTDLDASKKQMQPTFLPEILEKLSTDFDKNIAFFSENFTAFVNALEQNHNMSSESVRRAFGDGSETVRRRFGDKPAFLLFLIALDNTISAHNAAAYLGVSQRMVEKYITKLKDEGVLEREGGDFGGKWRVIG